MPSDDEAELENGGTTDEAYRWKYLSTAVTVVVTAGYIALTLGGAFGHTTARLGGGTWATFSLAFLAVIAYSVGVDTIKAAAEVRGGGE